MRLAKPDVTIELAFSETLLLLLPEEYRPHRPGKRTVIDRL